MVSPSIPDFDDMDIIIIEDGEDDFSVLEIKDSKRCDDDLAIQDPKITVQDSEIGRTPETSSVTAFLLLRLPSELRLMVLKPLIANGDLGIMRTSKLMHREDADLLKRNGVFRVNLGYADRISSTSFQCLSLTGQLTNQASPGIQHTEFLFNVNNNIFLAWARPFEGYINLIKAFGGRNITRQSCTISRYIGSAGCVERYGNS